MESCENILKLEETKTYTINEGKQFCDNRFPIIVPLTNGIYGSFTLGVGAIPSIEHDHINKLVGLAVGTNPHVNSLRIGWMYSDNQFHLYAYVYYKQKRHWKYIKSVSIGQRVSYFIAVIEGVPTIHVDDLRVEFDFSYPHEVKTGMLLFPYYGGQSPAPNTIKLQLSINT